MANSFIGRDMAVDLGTANTLVYVRGKGVLLDEPSVVALNDATGEILAVGHEAKRMIGRTPDNITAIRPLKDGVIADFEATEQMLRYFIQQVHRRRYFAKPRMVVCVPSGITAVEQRAVKEAGYQAGARRVYIVEEPMAAAIGAGLPVHQATGNMVVDVGGGTTEVAVISLGGIVTSLSIRTAGDDLDQAIVAWMKKEYSLMLGDRTAEEVKMTLGSAFPLPDEPEAEIRGRDMVSGLPRTVVVSSAEIRQALEEPLHAIVDAVRATLDQTPPELAGDIMDRGIVLTGGGALLRGLDERLRHETGMPVHVADDPLVSVALGAGKCVEEFEALQQVLVSERAAVLMRLDRRVSAAAGSAAGAASQDLDERAARRGRCSSRWCSPAPRLITLDSHGGADSPVEPARRAVGEVFGPARVGTAAVVRPITAIPGLVPDPRLDARRAQRARGRERRASAPRSPRPASTATGWRSTTASPRPPRTSATRWCRPESSPLGPSQSFTRTVTIDAGSEAGLRPDQTVLNNDGLVGRVLRVTRQHRDRAAHHRRRLHGRRPGRRLHGGGLPARAAATSATAGSSTSSWSTGPRCRPSTTSSSPGGATAVRRTSPGCRSAGSPRSSPASARPPSVP